MNWRLWLATTCLIIAEMFLAGCGPSQEQLATQTAIAATATFEALPTATPTRTPTAIPTPTLTPTETRPKPTATETEPAMSPEDYFIPSTKENEQEIRANGGKFLHDFDQKTWKDLKITGPGQVYAECSGKGLKKPIKDNKIISAIFVDWKNYGPRYCVSGASTREALGNHYKNWNPDDIAEVSEQLLPYIPDDSVLLDLYYALGLDVDPNDTTKIQWTIFESDAENSFSKVITTLDIPDSTTTKATPTP